MADSMRDDALMIARHRCEEAAALIRRASGLLRDVRSVAGLNGTETAVPGCIQEADALAERIASAAGVSERGGSVEPEPETEDAP